MKKNKWLGWAFVAAMMGTGLSACTNEAEEVLAQESEIKLTSEITPSRVNDLNYQSTQIVSGQQVGVTITGAKSEHNNVAWTAGADGALTNTGSTLYWGKSDVEIKAYHPYNPDLAGSSHPFSVNIDQSTKSGYLNSDLLWATTTASKTDNPIALNFLHKLAKINVTLTSEDIEDLSNAIISICGTNITTDFNPTNGELSNLSNSQDIFAGITTTLAPTASAIIIPQTITNGTEFIKVSHNNKNFIYTLSADKSFESGHSYSYTLKLKEKQIEVDVESDNITNWDDESIEGDMEEEVLEKSVIIEVAGTLSDLITEKEKYTLKTLKISGDINGDDVRYIREMAGYDVDSNETNGKLINLDLSKANIVTGGGPYLNYGANFWGFEYDEDSKTGQWIMEDKYTKNNCTDYMFIGLKQLKKLVLPKNLENLGDMTFYGCHSLKELTIPASVNYKLSYSQHFHACLSLEAIYVENGNNYLFSQNGCLFGNDEGYITLLSVPAAKKEFTLPSNANRIDSYAFALGNSLQELTILESSPELNPYFYDNFFFLQNFNVDKNNQRYATIDGVLYSKDLKTIECYPSGRTNTRFEIPNGVTVIGEGCFNTSWHLEEIIIPEGVETIGASAFFDCHNLHGITLPSTIKSIGASTFQHLHLYHLTCKAVNPPTLYDEFVFFGNYEKIYVPAESINLYKEADYWKNFADVIYPIE